MPKLNKGDTSKLSIRLSMLARQRIDVKAKNLGISSGGLVLFELTKLLENPPSLIELEQMENEITLERNHFVLTVNKNLQEKVNKIADDYEMKKNILIGYIVSNHFENFENPDQGLDTKPKKIAVRVNESLKKKMMDYIEENYITLSSLVTYSILEGPSEELPSYEGNEIEDFYVNVPNYVYELLKEKAYERNIREHFYTSQCLYKQFMTPEGRFYRGE